MRVPSDLSSTYGMPIRSRSNAISRLHPQPYALQSAFQVDWYVENGAKFLEDTEYPALPGFQKSFVTYQPLGVSTARLLMG